MSLITQQVIEGFRERLEQHAIYAAITRVEDLQCFMAHHVYSVWDFMSLIKTLQQAVAPTTVPWVPMGDGNVRRFINELVLEEESDELPMADSKRFASHFELYCNAMAEIGGDPSNILQFVEAVKAQGVDQALQGSDVPEASRTFTQFTFECIASNKPHVVAAALALGREHIIPCMFRAFLKNLGVTEQDAPMFHYYLNRHVHLDEDFHAPLSLRLLNSLCGDDEQKQQEAITAAEQAVEARVKFWDGVLEAIQQR